jgi:HlyD family secretion protein
MSSYARGRNSAEWGPARWQSAIGAPSFVRRPGFWIVLALLAVAGTIAALAARGPAVETSVASRTDLEQHVIASGRVRVVTRVELAAQSAGRVVAVRVVEGQRVQAGDVLVQLDSAEARAAVSQARAAVGQAKARVEQLRKVSAIVTTEASRQAQTNLARAEADLARVEKLAAAGAVARVDLDEARRSVEIARAQKSAADAQQGAAAPAGADSQLAASALLESEAQLAGATVRLEQTRVVARQDGIVLSRAVDPGDMVQPGKAVIEMAADGETQLVIEPDERNLAWIRLGQNARASADAYPQEVFDAGVCYIAPAVDPARGTIEVRLCVPEAPAFLKPDMTVSVDLTVAAKNRVLTVPSDAVRGAATGTPWVLVVGNGRVVRRDIVVGIRGEGRTEVASGLEEGAEVVVSSGRALAPGQRVRPRRAGER